MPALSSSHSPRSPRSHAASPAPRRAGRLPLCAGALAMMLLATTPSCGTPLAVAGLVVGTGSIVGGAVTYEKCDPDNKDGPVGALCGIGNFASFLLIAVGSAMVAGGGISLLVESQ
jgi:hypothetical protein